MRNAICRALDCQPGDILEIKNNAPAYQYLYIAILSSIMLFSCPNRFKFIGQLPNGLRYAPSGVLVGGTR
jgi:hypothetical protein